MPRRGWTPLRYRAVNSIALLQYGRLETTVYGNAKGRDNGEQLEEPDGKSEVRFESEVSLFHAVEVVLEREDATSVPVAEGVEHFSVDEDAEGNVWYGAHRRKVDEEGLSEFTLDEEDAEG